MDKTHPSIVRAAELIRAEYRESPGLCLRKKQVERLWRLDTATCEVVLAALEDSGILRCTRDGYYVRADSGDQLPASASRHRPRPLARRRQTNNVITGGPLDAEEPQDLP
jgi:hypothetical protein